MVLAYCTIFCVVAGLVLSNFWEAKMSEKTEEKNFIPRYSAFLGMIFFFVFHLFLNFALPAVLKAFDMLPGQSPSASFFVFTWFGGLAAGIIFIILVNPFFSKIFARMYGLIIDEY